MASIFSKLLQLPPGGMGRVVVGSKPSDPNETGIEVKAAIFFDGTGNNRNNTAQRRMAEHNKNNPDDLITQEQGIPFNPAGYEQYGKNKKGKPIASYEAGYSNVSILERMNVRRKTPQREISLYVEGIGTQDNLGDDTKGSAFGMSKTGVKSKVQIGVGRLAATIIKVLKAAPNTFVEKMTIDVFGFSRGATAARHFVSLLNATAPLAAQLGIPRAEIKIQFVGVFDTVSSMGYELGFDSDVEELGLAIAGIPQKVVHLAAANECRVNFSLTDIASSLDAGKGYELVLPGVHSNIGGSYGEVTDEEERLLHRRDYEELIAHGWYRREEITRSALGLTGRRLGLTWEYQFIPLRIMADCAGKLMRLQAFVEDFEKYALPPDHELIPMQAAVLAQVDQHGEQGRHVLQLPHDPSLPFDKGPEPTFTKLLLDFELIKTVRNRYLHRSASRGFQGLLDGPSRVGMGERRKGNRSYRVVFPG
jgi:hypothetical protein